MIIRTYQINKEYQFSIYKKGWIFEVINDFGEYYTAKVLHGSKNMHDSVIAVHKNDCKVLKKTIYEDKLRNTRL